MEEFIKYFTIAHVVAGSLALIIGPLSLLTKRQIHLHKPLGSVYFYAMSFIFISGLFLSVYHKHMFLFFISFFTYYAVCTAYRAIKIKNGTRQKIDWIIDIIAGFTHFGLLLFALYVAIKTSIGNAVVPLVFGSAGVIFVYNNVTAALKTPKPSLAWLKSHVGNMLGSYIGAITAFTVNQAWKWEVPEVVAWLGPSLIVVPVIIVELRKIGTKTSYSKT